MRVNFSFRVAFMLCIVMGVVSVFGGSHDYTFTIVQSQSNLTFEIDTSIGSDSDSSAVVGTVGATLDPVNGAFTSIHITDITADLVNTHLHFDFYLLWYHYTVDGYNAGLRMGGGYGQAGQPAIVTAGTFNQTGNLVQGIGQIDYDFGDLGSDTIDLGTQAPSSTDFIGTVVDNGQTITLTIPISLAYMDVGGMGLADAYVDGQIVATAETYILTCEDMEEFYPGDINHNCYVDIFDLVEFMQNWLDCNDPGNQDCQ